MRPRPPLRSSSIFLLAGLAQLTGCFLDASPFGADATGSGGSGGTTPTTTTSTSSATGGAGGATTTSTTSTSGNGGSGGTTTTDTTGGGGTGGTTTTTDTTGGGGTGGTTTTTTTTDTTPTTPTSCQEALESGQLTMSGVITIDPDGMGPELPLEVYCDQVTDGGGWALVYSSIGTQGPGVTTAFWNIAYDLRLETKVDPPGTPPAPSKNCYVGRLYRYGKQYRDDVVDTVGNEVKGALRAKATGINEVTMKLQGAAQDAGNLSFDMYVSQFAAGWSAPGGAMNDHDPHPTNCADDWQSVTQHYGGCWNYSLGASTDVNPDPMVMDTLDAGWGPHMINATIKQINMALPMGSAQLVTDGGLNGQASRVGRISRFTRW
jgi:hypothetical protein